MEKLNKFVEKLDKAFTSVITVFTVVGFIAMVLLIFVNVCGRYLFRQGITESEEIARVLFVWLTYCGAILCFKTGSHVMVDILVNFLHGATRKVVDVISNLLVSFILLVSFKYSMALITVNIGLKSPLVKIPMALVEGIIPAAMLIMLLMNIWKLIQIITTKYARKGEN